MHFRLQMAAVHPRRAGRRSAPKNPAALALYLYLWLTLFFAG
jgi:hypothetical protein